MQLLLAVSRFIIVSAEEEQDDDDGGWERESTFCSSFNSQLIWILFCSRCESVSSPPYFKSNQHANGVAKGAAFLLIHGPHTRAAVCQFLRLFLGERNSVQIIRNVVQIE